MLRGLAVRVTLDDRDAAGATSPQDALEFLRSNAMVVEVYSPTRLLAAADGDDDGAIHGDDVNRAFRAAFVGVVAR